MISVIRVATIVSAVVLTLTASIRLASAAGPQVAYVSATGNDGDVECPPASPCASIGVAINSVAPGGEVVCLSPPLAVEGGFAFSQSVTVDCAGTYFASGSMVLSGVNQTVIFRHVNFDGSSMAVPGPGIELTGSGSLVLENCSFENFAGAPAIEITPSGALKVGLTNDRISNSGSGVMLRPNLGFSSQSMPDSTQATLDLLQSRGIMVFGADLWAGDWNPMTPQQELKILADRLNIEHKGIILLHDPKGHTAAMLPAFLRYLRENHYHVVNLVPAVPGAKSESAKAEGATAEGAKAEAVH